MIRIFERIWADIRRGENIDVYATIIIAFSLVTLGLLGVASQQLLAPITLAVLGLLAISSLGNRYRIEALSERVLKSTDTLFLEEFPTTISNEIEGATDLWLVGVNRARIVSHYYSTIEKVVRKGATVKLLIVEPDSPALQMAHDRAYVPPSLERARYEALGTLEDLCKLQTIAPSKVEIHVIASPLGHSTIAININSTLGVLYIENYPYKTPGGAKPKFLLRAKDGRWYDFYKQELLLLWSSSVEWRCNGQSN